MTLAMEVQIKSYTFNLQIRAIRGNSVWLHGICQQSNHRGVILYVYP